MPLRYPLLYPYGEDGWDKYLGNKLNLGDGRKRTKMSMRDFFSIGCNKEKRKG